MSTLCEEETFSQVFNTYATTLYNFLYYKSGDQELSRDLMQEAFMKLWQNCAEVALDTAKGYVFMIAKNKLLNQFEHQKVKLKFKAQANTNKIDKEDPEYLLRVKEYKLSLEMAISELPEKQRVVFLMSRVDKKTYKEIAQLLGISKQAVEKRIYSALNTLRRIDFKIK